MWIAAQTLMPTTVIVASTHGIDAYLVRAEVDTSRQLPTFTVVGLPDSAVRESRERVMAAIRNSGYQRMGSRMFGGVSITLMDK